jgi:TPR repeat protein
MHKSFFYTLLACSMSLTGCGDQVTPIPNENKGQVAIKKTPEQEFSELIAKANTGDIKAMSEAGLAYVEGKKVAKNIDAGLELLKKAAEADFPQAQFLYGAYLCSESKTKEDAINALGLMDKAAQEGLSVLGYIWQGNSVNIIGFVCNPGLSNYAKAVSYFEMAAAQGDESAYAALGNIYDRKGFVDLFDTTKDASKALYWYRKAAEAGDPVGQVKLGNRYYHGEGMPKDFSKAVDWWKKSAAQGNSEAQGMLATAYTLGHGVPYDQVLAYAWSNLSIAAGNTELSGLRESIEKELGAEALAEAQRLSSEWTKGNILARGGQNPIGDSLAGTPSSPGHLKKKGTGTAFLFSKLGHAITNAHVVSECSEVRIEGRDGAAKLIVSDIVNDLAIIQVPGEIKATAAIISNPSQLRQGDEVVVYGFPLNSVLSSGGNLTPGIVSALTGLGNNTNQIQITAPIQPGSSGSPVLNKKGEVVAVVSMKLDDNKMIKATGQISQNINFAVSGQTLKTFIETNKVEYRQSGLFVFEKKTADLAEEARKWTTVVECWK